MTANLAAALANPDDYHWTLPAVGDELVVMRPFCKEIPVGTIGRVIETPQTNPEQALLRVWFDVVIDPGSPSVWDGQPDFDRREYEVKPPRPPVVKTYGYGFPCRLWYGEYQRVYYLLDGLPEPTRRLPITVAGMEARVRELLSRPRRDHAEQP